MQKVLITGFEPFGGEMINPSYEAIKLIDQRFLDCELHILELPVAFYDSSRILIEKMHDLIPDIIIMVGQAGGRKEISVERVAINLDDTQTPDNKGVSPLDDPIALFGPNAYFSTLPCKQIVSALKDKHIPAGLSYSAGTYVCNHLFYNVMHDIHQMKQLHMKAGFIHVPYETSQTLQKQHLFSLDLNIIKEALHIVINTTLQSSHMI